MNTTYNLTNRNASDIPRTCDAWTKTIRNAYQAAKLDGRDRIVGATYSSYFITDSLESVEARQHGQLKVDSLGQVFRITRTY